MAIEHNLVCFNTFGSEESWTLATYEKHDGYKAWRKIVAGGMTPEEVISAFNGVYPSSKKDYNSLKDALEELNERECPCN